MHCRAFDIIIIITVSINDLEHHAGMFLDRIDVSSGFVFHLVFSLGRKVGDER